MKPTVSITSFRRPEKVWHGLLFLCALAFLLTACGGGSQQTQQNQPTPVPLPPLPNLGGLPSAFANLQPNGTLPLNVMLPLTIGLKTDRQALADDLASIYDPSSSQYQHYLTPQDLTAHYGASQDTINKVTSFLQSQGFQITSVSPLHNSINVSASIAQIAQAFHVVLALYQKNGATFFGPSGSLALPAGIQSLITSITGLSDFAQPMSKVPTRSVTLSPQESGASLTPQDCSAEQGLSPNQVAAIYQYSSAYKAHYTGKGINIGVVEFNDNVSANDINSFLNCTTKTKFHRSIVKVDGGVQVSDSDSTTEAELDLEYLSALAPDAQLLEYQTTYCPGSDTSFDCQSGQKGVSFPKGYADILNQIAAEGRVQVVSSSWGVAEGYLTGDEVFAIDQGIEYLAAEGITFAAASGDCAAFAGGVYNQLAVQIPAADPYTVAVGGTILDVDNKGNRSSEIAWSDKNADQSQCQNAWGGGGGLSTIFGEPSWQQGPGVKNQYSNGKRQVPDISGVAQNLFLVFQSQVYIAGGTSAAAPIWAAGIALVDQGLQQHHKQDVGASPTFYRVANHPGNFHPYFDVTKGDDLYYPTTSGWDFPTGWGAPNIFDFGKVLGAF